MLVCIASLHIRPSLHKDLYTILVENTSNPNTQFTLFAMNMKSYTQTFHKMLYL